MEKENGVWRTIRGRRIFIASGESLGEAMAKSGKFKREDIRQTRASASQIDNYNRTVKKSVKARQEAIKKMKNKEYRFEGNIASKNQAEKNRINENAETQNFWLKRVLRNYDKYSETDRREIAHENLQKKLADYRNSKLPESVRKLNDEKPNHKVVEVNKTKYHEVGNGQWRSEKDGYDYNIDFNMKNKDNPRVRDVNTHKVIEDYKAKKQSNNKIEKSRNNYDSKTPEQAKAELGWGHHNLTNEKAVEEKFGKQSNNKIKKFVKKGNTFIPVRENENENDVVRDYSKENDKERMSRIKDLQHNERLAQMGARQSLGAKGDREVAEAENRRGRLIKYTLENKDKIKKWADEYDDERNQRAYEKTKRGEGLTKEEYFGFLARGPKEGDLMLTGDGAKRVGRNGRLEDIRESEYRDNVYAGKQEKIKNYVEKKKTNNRINVKKKIIKEKN